MAQSINGQAMAKADNFMVGFLYGAKSLAFYNFAWQAPLMISQLASSIDKMLYPVYVGFSDDTVKLRRLFNLACKMWSIFGAACGMPMVLFSNEIVYVLFGTQWAETAPLLQIMGFSFVLRFCTGYAYDNLVLVRGRTRYMMRWGLINTALLLTAGWTMIDFFGPEGGAWFWVLQAAILIPLVRIPIVMQELGTLEFAHHVWQPVVAGSVAALVSYLALAMMQVEDFARLASGLLLYVSAFMLVMHFVDKGLYADVRHFANLAKLGRKSGQ
jgi:O-antigen/teichoic acid export membrane protein